MLKEYIKALKKDPKQTKVGIKLLDKIVDMKVKTANEILDEHFDGNPTKEYRYKIGALYTLSDIIFNTLLLSSYLFLLHRVPDKVPEKFSKLSKKNLLFRCAHSVLTEVRTPTLLGIGLIPVFTEETSKLAAYKVGALREYLHVFNAVEFVSYVTSSIAEYQYVKAFYNNLTRRQDLAMLVPYLEKMQSFYSAQIKLPSKVEKSVIGKVKDYYNNRNKYREEIKEFLVYFSSQVGGRAITVGLHYLLAFLHTIGLSKTAMSVHFIWNAVASIFLTCFVNWRLMK